MSAVGPIVLGAMEVAQMWMEFARRAADMTEEEAAAEWQRVASRASQAEARWQASKS